MGEVERRRVRAVVRGRVQGVCFRASTQAEATRLGLAGWVRNRADGTVELEAEGPSKDVDQLLLWARHGPPAAKVESVEVADVPATTRVGSFEIHRASGW